jgi:hypothetical protein
VSSIGSNHARTQIGEDSAEVANNEREVALVREGVARAGRQHRGGNSDDVELGIDCLGIGALVLPMTP